MDKDKLDKKLQNAEDDIRTVCSPFNGDCFEVALSLYMIFGPQSEGFCSVYANSRFKQDPQILPLHITVQVQGNLFDASGHIRRDHLQDKYQVGEGLITFEDSFYHEHAISEEKLKQVNGIYEQMFEHIV